MAYGQDGHVGISFQQSFGTSFVDSMHFFPFVNETLTEKIEEIQSESLATRYEEPDPYAGMRSVEGEINFEIHPHLVGYLLKAWCGQSSGGSFVGSCYQNRFLPSNVEFTDEVAALPPITLEVYRDTGSAYLYYDCLANGLTLEIAQGALYKASLSVIGANFDWSAKQTATYEQGSFYTWDVTSVQLAGSGLDKASTFTITLNNNLEGKAYLDGTKTFSRILRNGYRTIEVAGTSLLVGDTEAKIYRARTQQRLQITATDPTTVMNAHNQLEIDIPKMYYTEFPANIGGPNLIEISFTGKGAFDSTSSYAIQFTVTNTTQHYY